MASNLVRKGFRVRVLRRRRAPRARARGARARSRAADVRGVAAASATSSSRCCRTRRAVKEVIGGRGGVHRARPPGRDDRRHEHDRSARHRSARGGGGGVGLRVRRRAGRPAGEPRRARRVAVHGRRRRDDVFARIKPMLEAMGTTIHHCGGVGTGMRTKLVNNYLAIISCQLNAEAIALSQRFGLSLEKTLDVIHGTTATNGQLKIAWPSKVLKGDIDARLHDRSRAQGSDADRRGRERREGAGADRGRRARGVQRGAQQRPRRAGFLGDGRRAVRRRGHHEAETFLASCRQLAPDDTFWVR